MDQQALAQVMMFVLATHAVAASTERRAATEREGVPHVPSTCSRAGIFKEESWGNMVGSIKVHAHVSTDHHEQYHHPVVR